MYSLTSTYALDFGDMAELYISFCLLSTVVKILLFFLYIFLWFMHKQEQLRLVFELKDALTE